MAWGKGAGDSSKADFVALCAKIETNKTSSNSLTLLHVKYISIWNSETIALFCKALGSNTSLEEVHCTGFDFGVEGCALLGAALQRNKTLKRLTFGHHSKFNDEQLAQFLAPGGAKSLEELDFERKNLTASSGPVLGQALASLGHRVAALNISGNALGNEGFAALCELAHTAPIRVLLANGISLTSIPVALPTRFTNLTLINLSDNAIGSEGMLALAQLECDELVLNNCEGGDEGCIALALGRPRKRLSLSRNNITSKGLAMLAQCHLLVVERRLEFLNLSHNNALGNDGLDIFAQNLALHATMFPDTPKRHLVLDASYCNATRIPSDFLLHLDGLNFGGNGPMQVDHLLEVFEFTHDNARTATLGLTGTGITDLARLFQALHLRPVLSVLECGGIPLSPLDRQALAALNEANPSLDVAVDRGEEDGVRPE